MRLEVVDRIKGVIHDLWPSAEVGILLNRKSLFLLIPGLWTMTNIDFFFLGFHLVYVISKLLLQVVNLSDFFFKWFVVNGSLSASKQQQTKVLALQSVFFV